MKTHLKQEKNQAQRLFLHWRVENFGNLTDLAERLEVSRVTLYMWRRSGKIPKKHHQAIIDLIGFLPE